MNQLKRNLCKNIPAIKVSRLYFFKYYLNNIDNSSLLGMRNLDLLDIKLEELLSYLESNFEIEQEEAITFSMTYINILQALKSFLKLLDTSTDDLYITFKVAEAITWIIAEERRILKSNLG